MTPASDAFLLATARIDWMVDAVWVGDAEEEGMAGSCCRASSGRGESCELT